MIWSLATEGIIMITKHSVRLSLSVPNYRIFQTIPKISYEFGKLIFEWKRL
jgi:hypothetical protein